MSDPFDHATCLVDPELWIEPRIKDRTPVRLCRSCPAYDACIKRTLAQAEVGYLPWGVVQAGVRWPAIHLSAELVRYRLSLEMTG